jgi:3-deoxy-manno-octulosonate cytidylyltransferase (CMP-KDO synthetase)
VGLRTKSGGNSPRNLILIPARLPSTRLPDKPMALIGSEPMIVHVWRRAVAAGIGPVVVACAEPVIRDAIEAVGGTAVLTDPALPSGTDRIHAALQVIDPDRRFERVVNLQGDMPTIDPTCLGAVLEPLDALGVDIGTLANATDDAEEREDPNTVKAVISFKGEGIGEALYFTRAPAPWGAGPVYHHIGIYAFTRAAIDRFAALPPSPLEEREKLEQLRGLENGMRIGVKLVEAVPFGVDTPADLEKARRILGHG